MATTRQSNDLTVFRLDSMQEQIEKTNVRMEKRFDETLSAIHELNINKRLDVLEKRLWILAAIVGSLVFIIL